MNKTGLMVLSALLVQTKIMAAGQLDTDSDLDSQCVYDAQTRGMSAGSPPEEIGGAPARHVYHATPAPAALSTAQPDEALPAELIRHLPSASASDIEAWAVFLNPLLEGIQGKRNRAEIIGTALKMSAADRAGFHDFMIPLLVGIQNAQDRLAITLNASFINGENRAGFLDFVRVNNIQNPDHIGELLQVHSPDDWLATWQGIQRRDAARPAVVGLANQTVHDAVTEQGIAEAIGKLRARYQLNGVTAATSGVPVTALADLTGMVDYLGQRATSLTTAGKLSADELRVIQANFNNALRLGGESKSELFDKLKLALLALADRIAAEKMMGHTPSDAEMDDLLAGWYKSAIVDSQLAYRRDRGDTSFPTDAELNLDQSCFGGSLNRIIIALNLIHPDVAIADGQGALANMVVYKQEREQGQFNQFVQNDLVKAGAAFIQTLDPTQLATLQADAKTAFDLEKSDAAAFDRLKPFIKGVTRHIQQAAVDYFAEYDKSAASEPGGAAASASSTPSSTMVSRHQKDLDAAIQAYVEGLPEHIEAALKNKPEVQRAYATAKTSS